MGVYLSKLKMWKAVLIVLIGWAIMAQLGCGDSKDHPDVRNVKVELQTRRLDRDLSYLDTNYIGQGLQQLKEVYPDFLDFYLDTLLGYGVRGNYSDTVTGVRLGLKPFLTNKDIRGLFDTVARHFPDTKAIEGALTEGFRYMVHYYPGYLAPKVIYFISGLGQWSVVTVDSTILGIGLDMYLGQQYPFYNSVQIPQYIIRKCEPAYIAANVFQAIYRDRHPFVTEDRHLLDLMIQRGKEQYFLSKVLPETPDSIRFGFTQKQIQWCEANEADVYNFFITKNLLYEKTPNKVYRFIFDAPTSAGMPAESPGNIGSWVGYRIVEAYVKQHTGISMEELFAVGDAQKMLQDSKYKPK